DGDPGDRPGRDAEVLQPGDVGLRRGRQQAPRRRALQRDGGDFLGNVLEGDVHAGRILGEPAQARVCRGPAVRVLRQARDGPVVDHLPVLVAPGGVEYLADGDLPHVAGDQTVDELRRVPA